MLHFPLLLSVAKLLGSDSDGESPFLDDIDRIARTDYEVSDYDIVRARLKTVGIQEYKFTLDTGASGLSLMLTHATNLTPYFQVLQLSVVVRNGLGGYTTWVDVEQW